MLLPQPVKATKESTQIGSKKKEEEAAKKKLASFKKKREDLEEIEIILIEWENWDVVRPQLVSDALDLDEEIRKLTETKEGCASKQVAEATLKFQDADKKVAELVSRMDTILVEAQP